MRFEQTVDFRPLLDDFVRQPSLLELEDIIACWIYVRLAPVFCAFENQQHFYISYFDKVFEILALYLDALEKDSGAFLKALGLTGQFTNEENIDKVAALVQIELIEKEAQDGNPSALQVLEQYPPNKVAAYIFLSLLQATYVCVEHNTQKIQVHISKVFRPLFILLISFVEQARALLDKYQEEDRYVCLYEWSRDYLTTKK